MGCRMPCGRCNIGVYAPEPVMNGVEHYRGAKSRKDAISRTPRCKTEPDKLCAGALDWLCGVEFPITDQVCDKITRLVYE